MENEERDDAVQAATGEMESSIEDMEARSDEVGEHIDDTRSEWKAKQQDSSVPGAEAGGESEAEEVAGDWEGEGPAAADAGQ
ncbi:MAG: hypothetical protein QOE65_2520 [Solirubrobacteraceae bacterium]|jgi:hypothetical protein|nr:hypothetical protein [Solirubrobacteraceae bacterium]